MEFVLPTTKDEMYAVLGELYHYYRVKKDPYKEIELLDLDLERQTFTPKTQEQLLEIAQKDLEAVHLKEIKDYQADLDEKISALSIKNALLQTEREKLRQDIVGRYDKSINKLEETILKNGLSGSGIAITQIVALENQKNKEITELLDRTSMSIAEYNAQVTALQERKDNATAYFSQIHQKQIEKRASELSDEQAKLEREIFKYNNSLDEKEQRYKNTLSQIRANAQARYIEMKVVDYTKDQLIEMGYYANVVKCITHFYDSMDNVMAYEDIIESERRLMLYLDDFYNEVLYMYKLRAYP